MKKIIPGIFFLLVIQNVGYGQDFNPEPGWRDGTLRSLDKARQDTSRVLLMVELANFYKYYLPDSALFYGYTALEMARQIKFPKGEVKALYFIGFTQIMLGNDSKALQINLQGLKIAEKNNLVNDKAALLALLGHIYNGVNNHTKALDFIKKSKALSDSLHDLTNSVIAGIRLVETYLMLNQPDSALYYNLTLRSAHELTKQVQGGGWIIYHTLLNLGKIQEKKGNVDLALAYFRQSVSMAAEVDMVFNSLFAIAQLFQRMNKPDSCIYYANKSLELVKQRGFYSNIIKANILISGIYEKSDPQKALQHSKMALSYKDSLYNLGKTTSLENFIAFDEQERRYEIETTEAAYRSQVKQYVLITGLLVFLLIAFILYRINKIRMQHEIMLQKQKASELEMQALRAQMNPHFIFNSLNSINMFILENNKLQASDYLSKFSRLVRLILQNSQEAFIPLDRELEALRLYLELESLRFEQKFEYKISVNDEVDTTMVKVPPLIIQPYAENAIWHGLMHSFGQQEKRKRAS